MRRLTLALALLAAIAAPVFAQSDYPHRTVTLVVPLPPGGTNDIMARAIADKLSAGLGQQVVVENRAAGGNGTVGGGGIGFAMRTKSLQAGPGMQVPVFVLLFLAPVYVPLGLLTGWIHTVASWNPITAILDSSRGFIDGIAEREGDHINVKLTLPEKKTIKLDGDIVFPTEQIHRIIAAAKEGKSVLELNVFDGSDTGDKVYSTLTVIGQAIPADRKVAEPDPSTSDDKMKALTRWPVTVSYYDKSAKAADGGEQTPVYAMSFELYENGVSRALALDYNDFVIAGAMSKLMVKDTKPCK